MIAATALLMPHASAGAGAGRRCYPSAMAADGDSSDEQLALAWAGGDQAAFLRLYARHKGRLYAFLLRSLGRRDAADDCFQDTWARAIAAHRRWRPQARFSTWLLQIAHNLVVDRFRRQRPMVSIDDGDGPAPPPVLGDGQPGSDPAAAHEALEQGRRLRAAIAALPLEQRTALLLRLDAELSLEEIAEVTGAGRETVKSRLRYAMDKLREAMG